MIEVGHIGLGALAANDDGGLDDVLGAPVRDALQLTLADLAIAHGHRGHIPFTAGSKDLLNRGLGLSIERGRDYVCSRDLLLAALTNPRVSAALTAAGANLDQIRSGIDAGSAGPDDTQPGGIHRPGPGRG